MDECRCAICGNTTGNSAYTFHDLHFRTQYTFKYFQCEKCQCLQIGRSNENQGQYYPENYYSYSKDDGTTLLSKIKWSIRDVRNAYYRTGRGLLGKIVHTILPCMSIAMIEKISPDRCSNILDIGCGSDALMLQYLARRGFKQLSGVDPYIKQDISIGNAVIYKRQVTDLDSSYDVITLNHSFEHMQQQEQVLSHCKKILSNNGTLILRIPTVSSFAWEYYKEFWPNLDAPRHLYLHSVKSIQILFERCGFRMDNIVFDSTAFQFWGAELYKKGFALHQKTPFFDYLKLGYRLYYSIVKMSEIQKLNNNQNGDTISLFLKHA